MTTLETKPTSEERVATKVPAGRTRPFRPHVIWAVFKRNLLSYFSNPAGYVFITLFVFISSCAAFWQDIFFTNNLANLDQLNWYMPYLLLLFIPAITMSTWADERRQGTDELLFTLPAHDLDVVLGKYLASLGIYYGRPGVFTLARIHTAVAGGSRLWRALRQLSRLLVDGRALDRDRHGRVALVLERDGGVHPGRLVLRGADLPGQDRLEPLSATWRRAVEGWSVPAQFQDFGTGVITLSGLLYFLGLAAAMLYVNMLLLGRRHWAGGEESRGRWLHAAVRLVAVVVSLASLTVLIDRLGVRADASAEKLHTLSGESLDLIKNIPADRPVLIQAYYSPEVPREFVEVKSDLLGLLKEYEARSGGKIRLNLVPTELYSDQARDAEKRFGIEPRRVFTFDQGKQMSADVFLGVAFTSGVEEVVLPFFDRGLPVEYELTRSIRVVSRSGRKKLGILGTDAKLMGGMDMRTFSQTPEWSIVNELKKQYDVSSVSPDAPISSDLDVVLVAQPSSMTQRQIDNLTEHVKRGGGTLLFVDPFPFAEIMSGNSSLAPEMPKMPPGGPFGGGAPRAQG